MLGILALSVISNFGSFLIQILIKKLVALPTHLSTHLQNVLDLGNSVCRDAAGTLLHNFLTGLLAFGREWKSRILL